jgi:hypothetical protein
MEASLNDLGVNLLRDRKIIVLIWVEIRIIFATWKSNPEAQ